MRKESRRIRVKGHYYDVKRDSSGRFKKVEKWGMSFNHDKIADRHAKKLGTKHRRKGVDIVYRNTAWEVAVSPNDMATSIKQLRRSRASKKYMMVPRPLVPHAKKLLRDTGIGITTPSGKIKKRSRKRTYI